jgi:CheY-like chemotaxis protein
VLLVDDDPNHVGFVGDALTRLGFAVEVEDSGRGCLEAAATLDPDVVLLDISMPGMDGWETARHLRESSARRIPIIMISADPRQNNQRDAAAGHHEAYLMKPLRLPALLDSMKQHMELQWIHDGTALPLRMPFSLGDLSAEQIPPPAHLARLGQLGQIGHIRGILAMLDEIGIEQPSAAPTLAHLRRLAEDCDLEGYKDTLEALALHAS